MPWSEEVAEVIERCQGFAGELQLQRRGKEFEIIYNGVFLMATYNGASEKAAVKDALSLVSRHDSGTLNVLLGGLGVGYSLQEALACRQVARAAVAEIEPAVIRWNRTVLSGINGNALDDSRVVMINKDFRNVLEQEAQAAFRLPAGKYDVIMVDTDNGSSWLSLPANAFFYSNRGLQLIDTCLQPGGVACFWCSRREESFEAKLNARFKKVRFHSIPEKTGQEGCYYLAFNEGDNNLDQAKPRTLK